jgi:hypothetical protein
VSLGASAIANITSAVSGSVVSISNFPASQTISGTVTANVFGFDSPNDSFIPITIQQAFEGLGSSTPVVGVQIANENGHISGANPFNVSGTVTANVLGNKPFDNSTYDSGNVVPVQIIRSLDGLVLGDENPLSISGTVTVGMLTAENSANAFPNQQSPVQLKANSSDGSLRTRLEYVAGAFSDTSVVAYKSPSIEAGSVVTYAYLRTHVNNSVTIGSLPTLAPQLPRVTFIDGSGTVTTANSAITVFASSTTRSYLLVQVTTGSAFVNVGATATTVNGISLTAGQGYAWETTIPQGLVSLISTTTSSRWVAKEA